MGLIQGIYSAGRRFWNVLGASQHVVTCCTIAGGFGTVEIGYRVRQGVVASTKGRWPRHAEDGATVNATVDERDSDMGGGAVFHDNRVEIEKVRA